MSDQSEKQFQLPPVSEGQLATILAALRTYEDNPVWTEHFDGIDEFEDGVDSEFVGELAEYLNCGSGNADELEDGTEKPYSVLLLYPDYIATQYGEETYLAQVTGTSVVAAMAAAQDVAWADQQPEDAEDEGEEREGAPDDFLVLMCVAGHHNDLSPGPHAWARPQAVDTGAPAP